MANAPGDSTVSRCEHCGRAVSCPSLSPYECKEYYPGINTSFNLEARIEQDSLVLLPN